MFICSQENDALIELTGKEIDFKKYPNDYWFMFCNDKEVARYSTKKQCEYALKMLRKKIETDTGDNEKVFRFPTENEVNYLQGLEENQNEPK